MDEAIENYDCNILYHPSKANVVADTLIRKSIGSLAHIAEVRRPSIRELQELEVSGVCLEISKSGAFLAHIRAKSFLSDQIRESQMEDWILSKSWTRYETE